MFGSMDAMGSSGLCFVAGAQTGWHAFLIVYHFESHATTASEKSRTIKRSERRVCGGAIMW